jgi:hypothetical protein
LAANLQRRSRNTLPTRFVIVITVMQRARA